MSVPTQPRQTEAAPLAAAGVNWRSLLLWAGAINASLFAAIGLRNVDREAIAFAVLYFVALTVRRVGRRGLLSIILLGLISLDTEFWMASATVTNVSNQEPLVSVLQPFALAIVSAVAIVAAAGSLIQRGYPAAHAGQAVAAVSIAVFVLAFGAQVVLSAKPQQQPATDLAVTIQNTAYSTTAITASSGRVSVSVSNLDLFWHTFTIDKLGVNVALPVGSHRQITFNAPPGIYIFYCQIPGHRQGGMQGTITIR